jgi:microcystin-dependent protein
MPVNGKSRRSYRGAPVSNTLGVTLSAAATNITLAVAISGWSTDAEPFFVVVDPGTAKEEKICVKYSSSTTLTVVDPAVTSTWGASAAGRGADGTTDRQHEQGAVIYPVFTATEANNANELVSKYANAGSVVYQGSGTPGTFTELAIGTAAHVLKVNSGATAPEWGQVATAGIADSAVTLAKLATALVDYLVPVGTINAYAGATAPTGWLLCNGTSTAGYTALAALVGATTPDMRGLFPMGKTAAGTGSTLLGTGGSTTIATGNLPIHSHANTAALASGVVNVVDGGTHQHTGTVDAGGGHGHTASSGQAGGHSHVLDATFVLGSHNHDLLADYVATGTAGASVLGSGLSNAVRAVGDHGHTVTVDAVGNHQHTFTTSTIGNHGHTASVNNLSVTMTNAETGSGNAYFPPFIAVNYIIKH